jgi:hypothetical protein
MSHPRWRRGVARGKDTSTNAANNHGAGGAEPIAPLRRFCPARGDAVGGQQHAGRVVAHMTVERVLTARAVHPLRTSICPRARGARPPGCRTRPSRHAVRPLRTSVARRARGAPLRGCRTRTTCRCGPSLRHVDAPFVREGTPVDLPGVPLGPPDAPLYGSGPSLCALDAPFRLSDPSLCELHASSSLWGRVLRGTGIPGRLVTRPDRIHRARLSFPGAPPGSRDSAFGAPRRRYSRCARSMRRHD